MTDETAANPSPAPAAGNLLGIQQRQALISNHPFFLHLPPAAITELARLMFEAQLSAGQIIVAQGDLVDSIYLIAKGTAEVTRRMTLQNKTETLFLASLHENDVIGLTEQGYFAPGGIRTATVTASTDVLLLGLKVTDFHSFLQAHPDFNHDTQVATELMIRMNFIREVTSFVQLSLGRIRWLAQNLEKLAIAKGTVIFKQDEPGDRCYLIYSGQVEISIDEAEAGRKILAVLKSPAMFGETALFTTAPRNATAIAIEDCELFAIKRQNILELATMEDTTNQAIRNLMVERSRPVRAPNILDYHNTTADGQTITTLKNPLNSHYYRLTKEGWFIWQQINGRHSLREITHAFNKQFKGYDANLVPTTIFNLANAGFIEIASLNMHEKANPSGWAGSHKWWSAIIIFIMLMTGIFIYLSFAKQPSMTDDSTLPGLSTAPVVTMVLAVNINNVSEITPATIKNGLVPLLAVHTNANRSDHRHDTISFINQFAELVFFDSDKNGRIDMSDPVFSHLELIFLAPDGGNIKRVPIVNAGIRALALDKPQLINYAVSDQPDKLKDVNNVVIMANNTTRQVQIIALDQSWLP